MLGLVKILILAIFVFVVFESLDVGVFINKAFSREGLFINNRVLGSGKLLTVNRRESRICSKLSIDLPADILIVKGEKCLVSITTDDNIVPLILTRFSSNSLKIYSKRSFSTQKGIHIRVEMPLLDYLNVKGNADVFVENIAQDKIQLLIDGNVDLKIKGAVNIMSAIIKGTSDVNVLGLKASTVNIELYDIADASIQVTESIFAKLNGNGDLKYLGNPPIVNILELGLGEALHLH